MTIYCGGEPAAAEPVYLASLSPAGYPRLDSTTPLYWRCSACGAVVLVVTVPAELRSEVEPGSPTR